MAAYLATALSPDLLAWEEANIGNRQLKELFEPEDFDDIRASWFGQFKYDRYDWNDPSFIAKNRGDYAYRVIPLTQGYFMIISPHDYERMTTFPDGSKKRWSVKIDKDLRTGAVTGIYAYRRGRGEEPKAVYAHRELIGCIESTGVVDHVNGLGLDNRRGTRKHPVNLRYTSHGENMHNAARVRTVHQELPPGVEKRKVNKRGLQLYGGKYCKRRPGSKKVNTTRSKRLWLTPGPAACWYRNQLKKLNRQRTTWAHNPESVSYPVFPRYREDFVPF